MVQPPSVRAERGWATAAQRVGVRRERGRWSSHLLAAQNVGGPPLHGTSGASGDGEEPKAATHRSSGTGGISPCGRLWQRRAQPCGRPWQPREPALRSALAASCALCGRPWQPRAPPCGRPWRRVSRLASALRRVSRLAAASSRPCRSAVRSAVRSAFASRRADVRSSRAAPRSAATARTDVRAPLAFVATACSTGGAGTASGWALSSTGKLSSGSTVAAGSAAGACSTARQRRAMGLPGRKRSRLEARPTDSAIRTAQSTATSANPTRGRFGSTPTGSPSHTRTRRQCGRVMTRDHDRWSGMARND